MKQGKLDKNKIYFSLLNKYLIAGVLSVITGCGLETRVYQPYKERRSYSSEYREDPINNDYFEGFTDIEDWNPFNDFINGNIARGAGISSRVLGGVGLVFIAEEGIREALTDNSIFGDDRKRKVRPISGGGEGPGGPGGR